MICSEAAGRSERTVVDHGRRRPVARIEITSRSRGGWPRYGTALGRRPYSTTGRLCGCSVEDGEQALEATVERGADAVDAVEVGAGHGAIAHHDEVPCSVLRFAAPW
jgi:hypothetical protein